MELVAEDDGESDPTSWMEDVRIVLNIGGTRFETHKSTFAKYPDTMLGAMFCRPETQIMCQKDDDEAYFFDRSGTLFQLILDYYRSGGSLVVPPGVPLEQLKYVIHQQEPTQNRHEIAFWQLPVTDEELSQVARPAARIGDLLRDTAIIAGEKRAGPLLDEVFELVIEEAKNAARAGCRLVRLEFPYKASYIRVESAVKGYTWSRNFVNPEYTGLLYVPENRWLLYNRLRRENFTCEIARYALKSFCIRLLLFGEELADWEGGGPTPSEIAAAMASAATAAAIAANGGQQQHHHGGEPVVNVVAGLNLAHRRESVTERYVARRFGGV